MANPQIENGHTKIANELLEAIYRTPMSDYEHRIFWLIVRKTYGFKKKLDWISQKQIVSEINILKQHVSRTIKKLVNRNMILKEGKKLSIQKDYDLWKLPKQVTNESNLNRLSKLPKQVTEVTHRGDKSNLNRGTQNSKLIQKILLQKEKKKEKEKIIVPYEEIEELFNSICKSLPKIKELTEKRKTGIRCRWLKYKNIDVFKELFTLVENSRFLTGGGDKGWVADFDWLINENNMIKVLEGNYNRRKKDKFEGDYST